MGGYVKAVGGNESCLGVWALSLTTENSVYSGGGQGVVTSVVKKKGKSVPLQAWSGPEGSRNLRFPDFMTTALEGGKVVSLTHRPHLPPGNSPGTHFCQRLSRPQGHSAIGRIMSMKTSSDTIWNRTSGPLYKRCSYLFIYFNTTSSRNIVFVMT